jgi:hypothetical protein
MLMLLWNPLRRWWAADDLRMTPAPIRAAAGVPALVRRRADPQRPVPRSRPLTPFSAAASTPHAPVAAARQAARRFWMTLDPEDRRRGAIGGSFAEVCAALERLAAVEEKRPH